MAAASLTLLAAASMAAAVVVSREGGGTPASPVPSSLGPSPTSQTSGSPEQPGTYVDEYIAEVLRELRGAGVTVDLTIKVDPSSRPGVILEQRPDPLPDGAERVAFVVAGRRHATQLDRDFVVAGRGPWSEGPQRIFGRGYGHAFYLRDADCFGDGYCYDYVDRKSPTLALNLGRQFEIVTATLGFDERSVVTERGLVSVVLRGLGAEEGKTVCVAEVGPTLRPLQLRLDVSGQVRLEIFFQPWRHRQIPAIGRPTGIGVNSGLLSPPATRPKNLLPTPPPNERCFE